ncbi:MAG: hypothetical protein H9Q65_06435 [Spiroplasma ixodetis]|nr:hypothetical protein [Spiroplasma ixodetis]
MFNIIWTQCKDYVEILFLTIFDESTKASLSVFLIEKAFDPELQFR